MRVHMKRNKNIIVTKFLVFALVLASTLFIVSGRPAYAADAGCYVTSQGTITAANCPAQDSNGDNIDASKCYIATGGSAGISSFVINDCSTISLGSGGTSTSQSGRNGSSSNECLTLSPSEKEALKVGDSCYALKTTQTFDDGENDQCGKGNNAVSLSVNIGCIGDAYGGEGNVDVEFNPIVDMMFAFFRFLSAGVGIVVIGSIILAGIQYSASKGNPQATEAAMKRISGSVIALVLYIFMFAIANFIIPGGMFI